MKRFFSALAVALAALLVIGGDAVIGSGASMQAVSVSQAIPVNTASVADLLAEAIPSPDAAQLSALVGAAVAASRQEGETAEDAAVNNSDQPAVTAAQQEAEENDTTALDALGVVTGTGVRMRSGPGTDNAIVRTMEQGTVIELTAQEGDWYRVSYDGDKGYISASYVTRHDSVSGLNGAGRVTADVLNIRSAPGSSNSAVGSVRYGAVITVTGIDSGWYAVSYNGVSGYVSSRYVALCAPVGDSTENDGADTADKPDDSTADTADDADTSGSADTDSSTDTADTDSSTDTAEAPSPSVSGSVSGSQVAALAQQYLGVPYVYGGSSPSGFDCSGFTMYIYSQFGISLPHGATSQLSYGTPVAYSDLQPGDLVFFQDYGAVASHVGIYIGGGEFIHASSSSYNGRCVVISSLSETYYSSHYYAARRH